MKIYVAPSQIMACNVEQFTKDCTDLLLALGLGVDVIRFYLQDSATLLSFETKGKASDELLSRTAMLKLKYPDFFKRIFSLEEC